MLNVTNYIVQLVSKREPNDGTLADYPDCGWRRLNDLIISDFIHGSSEGKLSE